MSNKPCMGFIRATHIDGKFRDDMREYWKQQNVEGLFHWLDSKPKTLAQLIDTLNHDETNWPEGAPVPGVVTLWLIEEIECDFVRVVPTEVAQ